METQTNTPTLTPAAMVAQLRALRQQIPDYAQLSRSQIRSLQSVARLNPDFLDASINAAGESPTVENAIGVTHEAFRQESAVEPDWQMVEEELRVTLKGVAAANLLRRHRLGTWALQAYGITRLLIRRPEHANLLPHFQTMKRANRFGKRKKATQTPGGDPQTPPQQQLIAGDTTSE